MTPPVTTMYNQSSTTECLPIPNIWNYLEEFLGHIIARSTGTSKDIKYETFGNAICYDDSSQEPLVPIESINSIQEAFSFSQICERNLQAIKFLDEWFAEPDDLGKEFWEEFDEELKANRFSIS